MPSQTSQLSNGSRVSKREAENRNTRKREMDKYGSWTTLWQQPPALSLSVSLINLQSGHMVNFYAWKKIEKGQIHTFKQTVANTPHPSRSNKIHGSLEIHSCYTDEPWLPANSRFA